METESQSTSPGRLRGRAVEDAAVAYVMAYERSQGRAPVDRRYVSIFPGDIESQPRLIEIKATATSYRGWFIPLEPIQIEHARTDPKFYLYVVENVGQGDPSLFTLRIISGEPLRELAVRATERRYFEVPWPTKDYDATPVEHIVAGCDGDASEPSDTGANTAGPVRPEREPVVAAPRTAVTAAEAIREAVEALGGVATTSAISTWVSARYPGRWSDIRTATADLAFPGSNSSQYPVDERFLERVSRGQYRLRGRRGGP